mmetsp:Transcript_15622/g.18821  ORF Transcript_15622/g.18821 Transcript_15622/m.18821 type:complete len:319 (+) Transcript_15622:115-1071(+)
MRNTNNTIGFGDEEEWEFLSATDDGEDEETSLLLREEQEYHIEEIEEEEQEEASAESSGVIVEEEIDVAAPIRDAFEVESQRCNVAQEDVAISADTEDEGVTEGPSREMDEGNGSKTENEPQMVSEDSSLSANDWENEEFTTPGLYILKDMGFSRDESKAALAACDGNVQQAVSVLLGEHQEYRDTDMQNHSFRDAAVSLKHRAKSVGRSVGREAERVCDDVKMACIHHDLPGKAKMAGHKVKLTARTVGREAKTMNEKFHITDALATVGVAVAAAAVAMGNPRAATAAVAMAGSAYVAGEGMKYSNERRGGNPYYDD